MCLLLTWTQLSAEMNLAPCSSHRDGTSQKLLSCELNWHPSKMVTGNLSPQGAIWIWITHQPLQSTASLLCSTSAFHVEPTGVANSHCASAGLSHLPHTVNQGSAKNATCPLLFGWSLSPHSPQELHFPLQIFMDPWDRLPSSFSSSWCCFSESGHQILNTLFLCCSSHLHLQKVALLHPTSSFGLLGAVFSQHNSLHSEGHSWGLMIFFVELNITQSRVFWTLL